MVRLFRFLFRWEISLILLIILAGVIFTHLSPYYLGIEQMLYSTRHFLIAGLLALGLMVIVVQGEIDLSLGSIVGVGTVIFAQFSKGGLPFFIALPVVLLICTILGSINGILVAQFRLPSLVVTLGTMGVFRGIAFIVGSERGYAGFSNSYIWVGGRHIVANMVPNSLFLLLFAIGAFIILMHYSKFGRVSYAIGSNPEASRFSGIRIVRIKIIAFAIAGFMAGLGSLVFIGQYGSARADNANGIILFVLTAVVLGGIDIRGGTGTVVGFALALYLLGTVQNGMGLANYSGTICTLVIGLILVLSILMSNIARRKKILEE